MYMANRSSSRGVLTYGLGTLYLTIVSSKNQSVYVFPADFASISGDLTLAFGVIPHDNVVRDILVVSEILQPLPGEYTNIYQYSVVYIFACMLLVTW